MNKLTQFAADAVTTVSGTISHHGNPVPRAAGVSIERYMGPWRVIAAIPLAPELGAHDPVETYRQDEDGSIETIYQFRKDSFGGELETKTFKANVKEGSGNAEWSVSMLGPLKAQYVISHVESDYSAAIVARDARDHVWILARDVQLSDERLEALRAKVSELGYDLGKLVHFPHHSA